MYSTHMSFTQNASAAPSFSMLETAVLGGIRSASVVRALPANRATSGLCSHLSSSTRGGMNASQEKQDMRASSELTVSISQSSVNAPSCFCSSSYLFSPRRMGLSLCEREEPPPKRPSWPLKRPPWCDPPEPDPPPEPPEVGRRSSSPAPSFLSKPCKALSANLWLMLPLPPPPLPPNTALRTSSSSWSSSSSCISSSSSSCISSLSSGQSSRCSSVSITSSSILASRWFFLLLLFAVVVVAVV
mmetsp:Transcript_8638/g.15999  ORF Transcript_8638/g.15999 Transcript_8638/m.15999 type:complete len:244 (-) Transcript_8638:243-974(-)